MNVRNHSPLQKAKGKKERMILLVLYVKMSFLCQSFIIIIIYNIVVGRMMPLQ